MLSRKIVNIDYSGVRHRLVGNLLGKHAVRVLSALFAIKDAHALQLGGEAFRLVTRSEGRHQFQYLDSGESG